MRILAALACAAAVQAATVAPLEGLPLPVGAVGFRDGSLLADGKPLVLADLDWIELERPAPPVTAAGTAQTRPGVWLTDGSWIATAALTAAPGDRIRATTPLGTHDLPLAAIAGWGANEVGRAADGLDRVLVASGPLDGRVRGLRDGRLLVETSLDPEPLALELAEVQGLRLAQQAAAPSGLTLLATTDATRPPTRLRIAGGSLVLAASGQPVTGDLLPTLRLRVDGGRRAWLSDLDPAAVEEHGAFDVVWPWKRDTDLDGSPLVLGGNRWAKGIVAHSAATLRWELAGRYVRLRALVGISDAVAPEGDCSVAITGDGRDLWRRERVRGGEAPAPLDLDLSGVRTLTLTIGLGERFDIGDHLALADAYLVTRR